MRFPSTLFAAGLVVFCSGSSALFAQTSPAAPATAPTPPPVVAPDSAEVVTLAPVEVNSVPIEKNIMPTSRPFNSVFGTDDAIMDIPRNVTIISREQLTLIDIRDVRDFSKLTSSSFTRANFGVPSNPDIRGSSADVFQNGMRERATSNGNGLPMDFNALESVNIVKGPATVIQGPSSYLGGFIDYITKRPTFDAEKGSVFATVGSYGVRRWGADYNVPVSDTVAVRSSYSGEDSDGYYESEYRKSQSLYTAVTWRKNDRYELFVNAQYAYMEYTENMGINRPTQELIDHHLYQTGTNINNASAASPGDPQNAANVEAYGNTVAWGPQVKFDRQVITMAPGDNAIGHNAKLQAIQTFTSSPDSRVVNNNLLTYTQREKYGSYYYSEIVDPTITLESRWEYQTRIGDHQFNTGLAGRYLSVKAYNDFGYEAVGVWDLTQPRTGIQMPLSTAFQNSILNGERIPVPGYPGRYYGADSYSSDSNESEAYSLAPFMQATWRLSDKFSALTGARADVLHVNATDPASGAQDEVTVVNPNLNASLVHRTTSSFTSYATVNYSRNTAGAEGSGGGYLLTNTAGAVPVSINKDSYRTPAVLYELGGKLSLLDNKLFVGMAVFDQSFTRKTQGSVANEYHFQGAEIEFNYQPNRNFLATLAYSAINGSAERSSFEAISTDIATVHPELQAANATDVQVQGLPKNQFSALIAYTFDCGFGASLNGTLQSEINNNWAGTVVIPWQYQLNASVFYTLRKWSFRLSVLNLTDAWNWAPNYATYGNESIILEPGIRGEFTVTRRF